VPQIFHQIPRALYSDMQANDRPPVIHIQCFQYQSVNNCNAQNKTIAAPI